MRLFDRFLVWVDERIGKARIKLNEARMRRLKYHESGLPKDYTQHKAKLRQNRHELYEQQSKAIAAVMKSPAFKEQFGHLPEEEQEVQATLWTNPMYAEDQEGVVNKKTRDSDLKIIDVICGSNHANSNSG
jgi:hypothetical protein